MTKSPNELETKNSELRELTTKVARLSEACSRSEAEAKELHTGVRHRRRPSLTPCADTRSRGGDQGHASALA